MLRKKHVLALGREKARTLAPNFKQINFSMHNFDDPAWKRIFENLVDDIEEQKCVLFLGPHVTKVNDSSLQSHLHDELAKRHTDDIAYYYEREGFFLFKDKMGKEDVQRALRRQLKGLLNQSKVDETIYKKIASLPFHLVISINPDTFLSDIALKYGVAHRFAFFNHRGDSLMEVEIPTRTQPLYFNLCGAKTRDDSFILDYDDLFSLLQASFGSPGLPERLRRTLQTAKSFLFLGFQFEKWYSQLLLRLLSGERAIKKFALQTDLHDPDTKAFLVQQFQVQFLGDDAAFFDALHQHCSADGLVKALNLPMLEEQQQVIRFLQNGELQDAVQAIMGAFSPSQQPDQYQQAVHLSSRFSNLENQNAKGTIDFKEYNIEFNKVVDSLLELNKQIHRA